MGCLIWHLKLDWEFPRKKGGKLCGICKGPEAASYWSDQGLSITSESLGQRALRPEVPLSFSPPSPPSGPVRGGGTEMGNR